MQNEMDNIEKLFAERFGNFESPTSEQDWNTLYSKLKVANFMKFSFATFNIYFLATLIALASTTVYFGVSSGILSGEVEHLENVIKKSSIKNEESGASSFMVDSLNVNSEKDTAEDLQKSENTKQDNILNDKEKNSSPVTSNTSSRSGKQNLKTSNVVKSINSNLLPSDQKNELVKPTTPGKTDEKGSNKENKSSSDSTVVISDSMKNAISDSRKVRKVKRTVLIKQDKVILKDTVVIKKSLKK